MIISDLLNAIVSADCSSENDATKKARMVAAINAYFAPARQPGRAVQAAAWLQDRPNRALREAARLFGVTIGAISVARARGPHPAYKGPHQDIPDAPARQPGRAVQAASWLQDRPFRTMQEAARLFGVTVGAISAARARGPYDAYEGPHRNIPDNPPANLEKVKEAVRWARQPGRAGIDPLADAARLFGVKLDHVKRWEAYEPTPR